MYGHVPFGTLLLEFLVPFYFLMFLFILSNLYNYTFIFNIFIRVFALFFSARFLTFLYVSVLNSSNQSNRTFNSSLYIWPFIFYISIVQGHTKIFLTFLFKTLLFFKLLIRGVIFHFFYTIFEIPNPGNFDSLDNLVIDFCATSLEILDSIMTSLFSCFNTLNIVTNVPNSYIPTFSQTYYQAIGSCVLNPVFDNPIRSYNEIFENIPLDQRAGRDIEITILFLSVLLCLGKFVQIWYF